MDSNSPKFKLNNLDLAKLGKGLLIALTGCAITYLTDLIPSIDWGTWTPLVVAGWSFLANVVRKWVINNK